MSQQQTQRKPLPADQKPGIREVIAARWQLLLEEWVVSILHRTAGAIEQKQQLVKQLLALPDLREDTGDAPRPEKDPERDIRKHFEASSSPIALGDPVGLRLKLWCRSLENDALLHGIATQKRQLATEQLLRECTSLTDPVDQRWLNGAFEDFETWVDEAVIARISLVALVHFGPIRSHRTGPDWDQWIAGLEKRLPRYVVAEISNQTSELLGKLRGREVTRFNYETAWDDSRPSRSTNRVREI